MLEGKRMRKAKALDGDFQVYGPLANAVAVNEKVPTPSVPEETKLIRGNYK